MKRSTQIGLAAAGVVLVATAWSLSGGEDDSLVYENVAECRNARELTSEQCDQRFAEAKQSHEREARKYPSTAACESEYGLGQCTNIFWNNAQVAIPAFAGIMLARHLAQRGGAAQPLMPPTTQACPPGSTAEQCQRGPRSSSSSSSSSNWSSSRSRAYTSTSGQALVARSGSARLGTSVSSRGGFGSTSRSFGSSSS